MSDTELVSLDDLDDGRATLFEHEPHTVRLSLAADEGVPVHQHPDRQIVFHQLSGELDLHLGDEVVSLTAGDVVRFDGDQDIAPRARTDSEALLILASSA
ncbi:cupin domain-containing protein [Halomicrobium katesii]|uniref:cupin domain-containing protein n=1 Tax=Halomicrobium katesii TaxID=437163 RepID=UPI00036F71F6|nr:cupin domain-containing protein [Halomicrobium katesii]